MSAPVSACLRTRDLCCLALVTCIVEAVATRICGNMGGSDAIRPMQVGSLNIT